MPFTSETAKIESKKAHAAKKEYKENLWEFIASGGIQLYQDRLQKQYEGVELTKPEQEAMDRTEKLFPFVKARKTDVTTDGEKLPSPILPHVCNNNSDGQDNEDGAKD
jgi:hypothetical protein